MQCPWKECECEYKQMEQIPCDSQLGNFIYAHTCTKPDITSAVGMLSGSVDWMRESEAQKNSSILSSSFASFRDERK